MKRYQLLEAIGAGGTGLVHRAIDRLTGAAVALKRLDSADARWASLYLQEPFLQSIVREFGILAGLRHPHVITVLDYGFDADRHPFFTMDLLDDPHTITEAARDAPFETRVDLLIQLLEALAYLHRRGVLHRDLKPSNVLVVDGTVRVLDFGLASLGDTSGQQVGTVAYMAPESLRRSGYVPASDLYSVGVMMYELLTGDLPFQPGDVLAILQQPPDLDAVEASPLQPIVQRLLEKDPAARFRDADAVIAALAAAVGREVTEQPPIRESYLQAAPFTGRTGELARLTEALDAMLRGHGGAILVGGESGVGKSRLLSELRTRALTAGAYVVWGQAVTGGGLPYQVWRDPIAHLVAGTDPTDFEAGVLTEVVPDVERLVGRRVPPPAPLTGEAGRERLAQVVVTLLQRFGQPVLLLLEDLQWAGESLAILNQVNRAVETMPLLIVGSFRSDESPDLPSSLPEMATMPLDRLSGGEVRQLATAMIGIAGDRRDVIERLQRESDGNVFFLIETIRFLAEQSGALPRIGIETLPTSIFPDGVAELVRHRLSFVPNWARELLNLAAAAGRQIEPDLLVHASDEAPDLDQWLYACANVAVLEVRENRWRFAHDKLREVLLHDLPTGERADLHRQLALTIEALHPDDPAQAKRLADHWHAAGDIDRTLLYVLMAGDFLQRTGSVLELRELSERGLALLRPGDDRLRVQLLNLLGSACRTIDLAAAQAAYGTARELAEEHGWGAEALEAALGLAMVHIDQNAFDAAEPLLDRVISHARTDGDVRTLQRGLQRKARLQYFRNELEQALATQQQGLLIARELGDDFSIANHLLEMSDILIFQARIDEGTPYLHEAVAIGEAIGARGVTAAGFLILGTVAGRQGDLTGARAYLERGIPLFKSLGIFSPLVTVYLNLGTTAHVGGHLDEARSWYQESARLAERIGHPRKLADALRALAMVEYDNREFIGAREHLLDVVRLAADIGHQEVIINAHDFLARTSLKLGDPTSARNNLRRGLAEACALAVPGFLIEMISACIALAMFEERCTRAAELFGLVHYHPDNLLGEFFEHAAYQAQLEHELDPDDLEAATERGKTLDLAATADALLAELTAITL